MYDVHGYPYRKALEAIREHGPDNVAVILQGRMVRPSEIGDAGMSAMPKHQRYDATCLQPWRPP